jgi:transcriptional regulator with XRE-family HTH domain
MTKILALAANGVSGSTEIDFVTRQKEDADLRLGEHLRAARKKAGLTQEAVAAQISRPATSISDWERGPENGGRIPHIRILLKLAEVYGVTLDELVTGRPPAQPTSSQADDWSGVRTLLRSARRVLEEEGDPARREKRVTSIIEAAEILTDGTAA